MGIAVDLVAEIAAQQFRHRLVQQLARQVPQRHVDAGEDPHGFAAALLIGIEHVVEMDLDRQRVLADQAQMRQPPAAIVEIDHRAGHRPVALAFAETADARIGVDADQGLRALEVHRLDGGDLHQPACGLGQRVEGGKEGRSRQRQRIFQKIAAAHSFSLARLCCGRAYPIGVG